eukprot:7133872-Pyramimonas_sp.AAC.1
MRLVIDRLAHRTFKQRGVVGCEIAPVSWRRRAFCGNVPVDGCTSMLNDPFGLQVLFGVHH